MQGRGPFLVWQAQCLSPPHRWAHFDSWVGPPPFQSSDTLLTAGAWEVGCPAHLTKLALWIKQDWIPSCHLMYEDFRQAFWRSGLLYPTLDFTYDVRCGAGGCGFIKKSPMGQIGRPTSQTFATSTWMEFSPIPSSCCSSFMSQNSPPPGGDISFQNSVEDGMGAASVVTQD